MKSADELTDNPDDYVLAKNGSIYAVYLPQINETKINLQESDGSFSVKWYNPRLGGKLETGSVKKVKGGGLVSIGTPISDHGDWIALLISKNNKSTTTKK